MSTKTTRIIDLNLFSGSSEALRQAAGGYYGDIGGTGDISFLQADEPDLTLNMHGVQSIERSEVLTDSNNSILPRIRYANRLYSDTSFGFVSDEDWKTFMLGGTFGTSIYPGIYNPAVYADHANTSPLPYTPREVVNISEDIIEPSLIVTTEYFNHYPRYQNTVGELSSELEAPNYYMLDSASYLIPETTSRIVQSDYQYENINIFLTNSYVNSDKILDTDLENIMFIDNDLLFQHNDTRADATDMNIGFVDNDLTKLYSLMPFGNKVQITQDLAEGSIDFKTILENNHYDLKFVKLLKEIFQGESGIQPATSNFAVNTVAERSTGTLTRSMEETATIPVRIVDATTMLLYAYRNPLSETNNITVMNSDSGNLQQQVNYCFDTTGTYRYENTQRSLSVLNEFVEEIKNKFGDGTIQTYPLRDFLNQANVSKYHETVAFRIEKIGGAPTGDSRTENTIQNIWFYNNNSLITYLDTQVKYDTDYTYKIYKYDIVQGYKYQLSDMVVTRQIATGSTYYDGAVYCLEFYNPATNQTSNALLDDSGITTPEFNANLLSEIDDLENQIRSLGQENSSLRTAMAVDYNTLYSSVSVQLKNILIKLFGNMNGFIIEPVRLFASPTDSAASNIRDYIGVDISLTDRPLELIIKLLSYGTAADLDGDGEADQADIISVSEANSLGLTRTQYIQFQTGVLTSSDRGAGLQAILEFVLSVRTALTTALDTINNVSRLTSRIRTLQSRIFSVSNDLTDSSQINSIYPHAADFNITIEPSLKIIEIPLEEKRMRIVDHPPNDFVVTPHHLLDQSNRLAFYCKYDTFSMKTVTYPPTLSISDVKNKAAYLEGHDFVQVSELTQESVSRPRFLEVYRSAIKPTSYSDFITNPRDTIDLQEQNGDIATDHLFVERVRENIKYYYAFRALNENGIAGQMSPVFEAELINDGGYVYSSFEQYSEDDLQALPEKQPLTAIKKLFSVVPNIQHLELDTSETSPDDLSSTAIENISIGSNVSDPLFSDDTNRYFKIRLTSKKTGRKLDINIGFKKEVRK